MNSIKEQDILDKSKLALGQLFGDNIKILDKDLSDKDSIIDGHLIMNGHELSYIIISNPTINKLIKRIRGSQYLHGKLLENPLLILDHASKELIKYLLKENLFFIDSSGNCFINLPNLKIFVEGRKNYFVEPNKAKRSFQKTGLKLIYHLLSNPNLVNRNYRYISEYTDISLASVSYIFEELKDDGFIINVSSEKKIISNAKRLITKWANSYHDVLRPKIRRGYFTTIDKNSSIKDVILNISKNGIFIGGEYAAYYLYKMIKPTKIILYTNKRLSFLAKDYGIVPIGKNESDKTKIEILENFWAHNKFYENEEMRNNQIRNENIVNPILIYADLISSNDYRSVETAEEILENEIRNQFIRDKFQW